MQFLKKILNKQAVSNGIVSLSFLRKGFALAIADFSTRAIPRLSYCDFIFAELDDVQAQLDNLSKKLHLDQYDCHLILPSAGYRTITLEAPAVEATEMKEAIRWKIADTLDFPADQAIIDYYPLPQSVRANSIKMLEVVACSKAQILPILDKCRNAGLHIKVIDIQETSLRNLATQLPENRQGVAVLYLQKNSGTIVVQRQGTIYLSRKIEVGYFKLSEADLSAQNHLALEIQRSFDYVESSLGIPPISSLAVIVMPGDIQHTQNLINFLNISYGITARLLDLTAIVDSDILLPDSTQALCAPVVGATLRYAVEQRNDSAN